MNETDDPLLGPGTAEDADETGQPAEDADHHQVLHEENDHQVI